jgi:hypothetical protein
MRRRVRRTRMMMTRRRKTRSDSLGTLVFFFSLFGVSVPKGEKLIYLDGNLHGDAKGLMASFWFFRPWHKIFPLVI